MLQFLINIDVDDLAGAERFYCDAVGLRVGRRLGETVLELVGGPAPIYLLAKRAGSTALAGSDQRRDYARHWTPVHLDFAVTDIAAAVKKAQAAGARLESGVATHAWGSIAALSDPFGHGFCLIEFRGRGYDELLIRNATAEERR